jgi:uncharacterized membrane-anchored protein YhcB (DUF1043 family)
MDAESLILWSVALIVSIVFGALGIRAVKSKRRQNQKIKGGSVGIQSGRDVTINHEK